MVKNCFIVFVFKFAQTRGAGPRFSGHGIGVCHTHLSGEQTLINSSRLGNSGYH